MKKQLLMMFLLLMGISAMAQQQWTELTNYPGQGGPVKDMMVTGNHLFVVTPGGSSTTAFGNIFQTLDDGASWIKADSNIPNYYGGLTIYYDQNRNTLIYGSNAQNGCYTATDLNNPVWTRNTSFIRPCVFAKIDSTLFFSDQISGVFRTTDDCNTWTLINPPASPPASYYLISKHDTLFASMQFGGTFRSTNKGNSWTAVNTGLGGAFINTYFVKDNYIFAGSYYYGIFRTGDNGASWTTVNTGLPATFANRNYNSFVTKNDSLFVGADTAGVYVSVDNGANWMPFNNGLPANTTIYRLIVSNNKLFAGTNNGKIYRLDAPVSHTGISGINEVKAITCYPNPANGTLRISNPSGQTVKVTLTSSTGSANLEQIVSGKEKNLDVSGLANGLYILKTSTGQQQKVIINH